MPKNKEIGNLALAGYNELFSNTIEPTNTTADASGERIVEIPLSELHPPEFHPFNVNDDEEMDTLTQSVK